jgi:hypothetical protein
MRLCWCDALEDWALQGAIKIKEGEENVTVAHAGCYEEFLPNEHGTRPLGGQS